MTYRAPINDMLLALNHGAGLQAAVAKAAAMHKAMAIAGPVAFRAAVAIAAAAPDNSVKLIDVASIESGGRRFAPRQRAAPICFNGAGEISQVEAGAPTCYP